MNDIDIHLCVPGDAPLFAHIAPEVFDYEFDRDKLEAYFALPTQHLIIAISDGTIVGQLSAISYQHPEARPGELYIDELGVTPEMQRRGIATRLMERAHALAADLGCSGVWLGVEPDNEGGRALNASLPGGAFEDALVFSRTRPARDAQT